MNLRNRKQNMVGRVERVILRAVLVLGLLAAVGLSYLGRGAGEGTSLFLPGLAGLAVVGGVNWFGRVRARGRWEAAWDAYSADEWQDDRLEAAEQQEEADLYLAGAR